jgi:hypothetical protein
MNTIEYRTVDKSDWERGPWDDEADKKQWQDIATGLPCLLHRNGSGALCGYVGVPVGHPWHGKGYDDCGRFMPKPEGYDPDWYPDVHGGLTYADSCSHGDDPSSGICHIPADGEPDDVWWLGFDCAHAGDKSNMSYSADMRERWPHHDDVYRDQAYVEHECARLAAQAASVQP